MSESDEETTREAEDFMLETDLRISEDQNQARPKGWKGITSQMPSIEIVRDMCHREVGALSYLNDTG